MKLKHNHLLVLKVTKIPSVETWGSRGSPPPNGGHWQQCFWSVLTLLELIIYLTMETVDTRAGSAQAKELTVQLTVQSTHQQIDRLSFIE